MEKKPFTVKEALYAELLGDLDKIMLQFKENLQALEKCQDELEINRVALEKATTNYRQAVIGFTEQAKKELADYVERKAAESVLATPSPKDNQIHRMIQPLLIINLFISMACLAFMFFS